MPRWLPKTLERKLMARVLRRLFSSSFRSQSIRMTQLSDPAVFAPPINRSMRQLDRSYFRKTIPTSAVTIFDPKAISNVRKLLTTSKEALIAGLKPIFDDENTPGAKCLVLDPKVKSDEPKSWSQSLTTLVNDGSVSIRPYDLQLTYDDFAMTQILDAILPELPEDEKETPAGFSQAGHVAHVNLRSQYLPYKYLIGQILADKNPQIKTVINKTLDVGTESVFRTFPYEVLCGPDDLNVTVSESGCEFQFDFAKVYWNTRLGTEHERLVRKFQPGEAVCDVMAGVGPFALPAGKRKVFVRANDLNPDAYSSLSRGIIKNKVAPFVLSYCEDGRAFIRNETQRLPTTQRTWVKPPPKVSRNAPKTSTPTAPTTTKQETLVEPATFDHYVMNLPATAVEFLDAFTGVYHGRQAEFTPQTNRKLPMVHVYTFQPKRATDQEEIAEVCEKVSTHLGAVIDPEDQALDIDVFNVRLVAPQKWMYCVSFRLPAAVAFAEPTTQL